MSSHHPDDFALLDYAAGSLGVAQALAVSVHLGYCRHCQEQLRKLNALGGVLLAEGSSASLGETSADEVRGLERSNEFEKSGEFEQDPVSSTNSSTDTDGGFEALMARIQASPERQEQRPKAGFHNPLDRYLPAPLGDLKWQQQTREIAKFDLSNIINVEGARVALQKIKAGAKVPVHTHRGNELTVVLKGGFSDELGVYHSGDFIARDPSHHHSPTALQNEDCICLTVLDAPMRFTGPFMRLLNPLMGWKS